MQIGLFLLSVLALGLLLLALGYYLGRATAADRKPSPSTPPQASPQGNAEEQGAGSEPPAAEGSSPQTAKGLEVRTDPQQGHRLVVQVDGFAYLRYDAMTDDHRHRLRTYLLQIRDWMETTRGNLPATPARSASRPVSSGQEIPVQETVTKTQDMVSAINAIVQAKSKAQGISAAVSIMRDWRGTGVVIMVDGIRYDAVDDIPDAGVQQLIREAVREWEILQRARKRDF